MSKRKYVLAASLGVIGALLMSGTASAAVTGISYTATVSPKKQSNKTFGPASISNNIETFYTGGFLPTPTETALVLQHGPQVHPRQTSQGRCLLDLDVGFFKNFEDQLPPLSRLRPPAVTSLNPGRGRDATSPTQYLARSA